MSPKRPSPGSKRFGAPRRLGDLARPLLTPSLRRQGFAQHEIVTRWREIVGPLLGDRSLPERLRFPQGTRKGGTLSVLVDSAFALEFQHLTPQILERVNTFYGYTAVEKLVLRQGPVPRPRKKNAPQETTMTAETEADLEKTLADLKPGPLRDTLLRLGKRVLTTEQKSSS